MTILFFFFLCFFFLFLYELVSEIIVGLLSANKFLKLIVLCKFWIRYGLDTTTAFNWTICLKIK